MTKDEGEEVSEERRKLDYETPPKIPGQDSPLWTELILAVAVVSAIMLLLVLFVARIKLGHL